MKGAITSSSFLFPLASVSEMLKGVDGIIPKRLNNRLTSFSE